MGILPLAGSATRCSSLRRKHAPMSQILESYVTKKGDRAAALAFMKKALKRHGTAEVMVTDALRS